MRSCIKNEAPRTCAIFARQNSEGRRMWCVMRRCKCFVPLMIASDDVYGNKMCIPPLYSTYKYALYINRPGQYGVKIVCDAACAQLMINRLQTMLRTITLFRVAISVEDMCSEKHVWCLSICVNLAPTEKISDKMGCNRVMQKWLSLL